MAEGGLAGTAFVDLVPRFGAGFGAGLASKLKGLAAPAAVVGIGAGLFSIGEKFEKTFNAIKVQTGATGGVFEKLKADTKTVLAGTAGSFDQVSAAIGGLFQRTHLTGPALDDLAKREVTLGRITKTDVGENVEATTSLFNRYGISAKNQGRALDVLFKASQAGGKGIGTLTGELQKGAPALEAYGFGFEKSAALVASLEGAGVNVTPVLTGLRTAFGKIAKEGKDPQKVLAGIFKELRDGKDPVKATGDAIKLFGARGGAELSSAIRAGRFDVDGLLKTITNGKDGIIETGNEVSTIGGKFARLKNIALVALEPIGTKLVDVATQGVGKLVDFTVAAGPVVGRVFGFIGDKVGALASLIGEKLAPTFDSIGGFASRAFTGIKDVISNFGDFVRGDAAGIGVAIGKIFGFEEDSSQTSGIIAFAQNAREALGRLLTGARTLAAGINDALHSIDFGAIFGGIKDALAGVVTAVRGIDFAAIFGRLKEIVAPILPPLLELGRAVIKLAVAAFPVLVAAGEDLVHFAIRLKPLLVGIIAVGYVLARVIGVVVAVAVKATAIAVELLAHHAGILRPILVALVAGFVALKVVRGVSAGITSAANAAKAAVGNFRALATNAKTLFRSGSDTLRLRLWQVRDVATKSLSALKSAGKAVLDLGKSALSGAINLGKTVAAFVAQKAAAIASAVATKAMAAAQWLLNVAMEANPIGLIVVALTALVAGVVLAYQHFGPFRRVVDAVGRGLRAVADVITGAVAAAFGWVKSHWPLLLGILTGPFGLAFLAIKANWSRITGIVSGVFNWVRDHWPLLLAILTGPFGLAVLAIKGHFDQILGFFRDLPGKILGFIKDVGAAAAAVGSAILHGIVNGVTGAVGFVTDIGKAIANGAIGFINTLIHKINDALDIKIKGPGFLPDIHLNPPDIPDIPKLAEGGVINEPTLAVLGETSKARPEIATPATLLRRIFRTELDRTPPRMPDLELKVPKLPRLEVNLPTFPRLEVAAPKLPDLKVGKLPTLPELKVPELKVPKITLPKLEVDAPKVLTVPDVPTIDPRRFAAPFRPPTPHATDTPLPGAQTAARALEDGATRTTGDGGKIIQENHFHGHDLPTAPELDYAGRKLQWALENTGRRPGG